MKLRTSSNGLARIRRLHSKARAPMLVAHQQAISITSRTLSCFCASCNSGHAALEIANSNTVCWPVNEVDVKHRNSKGAPLKRTETL
jgi:hypothetical protein